MPVTRRKDLILAFVAAVFIYTVTAIFSVGYELIGEHYQIIEFARYKMGLHPEVAGDPLFTSQTQSGLQPMLAWLFLNVCQWIGCTNPFNQLAVLRLLMGLACLLAMLLSIKVLLPSIKEKSLHVYFIVLTPLIWFMPYISIRFSQETFSGCLFLAAFSLVMLRREVENRTWLHKIPLLIPGILMGLAVDSYIFTLVMLIAFLAWLMIFGEEEWKETGLIFVGVLVGQALGAAASYWLYGSFCYPPWNRAVEYYTQAHAGGVLEPLYNVFLEILMEGGHIVGIITVISIISFWIRHPKNPVTFLTLPYILTCAFLPEQEISTYFPLAFFVPYMIMYTGQDYLIIVEKYIGPRFCSITFDLQAILFILCNSIFIFLFAFKPADPDTAAIKYIHSQYRPDNVIVLYANNSNPFQSSGPNPVCKKFYIPPELEFYPVKSQEDIEAHFSRKDKLILLCVREPQLNAGFPVQDEHFVKVFESMPKEYFYLTGNNWEKEYEAMTIFQFRSCRLMF